MYSAGEIEKLSQEFETRDPREIIRWAIDAFGVEIAISSSFQTQSMPLLHMVTRINAICRFFFLIPAIISGKR